MYDHLILVTFHFSHGTYERSERRSKVYQQCWKAWQKAGVIETLLQSDRQILDCHDEAWWVYLIIRDIRDTFDKDTK